MVKHIVMWRFNDKDMIDAVQSRIEAMRDKVPSLLGLETGRDFTFGPASYDLVLISTHTDKAALDAYQADTLHSEVKAFIAPLVSERAAVDFEI